MPSDSPFKVSWWYRKEFSVTPRHDGQVWLNFDGINYRANLWLNGKHIADDQQGRRRLSHVRVQRHRRRPGRNSRMCWLLRSSRPEPNNLAITWVDWNPDRLRTKTWDCGAMFV